MPSSMDASKWSAVMKALEVLRVTYRAGEPLDIEPEVSSLIQAYEDWLDIREE